MNSRDKILNAVNIAQPEHMPLPDISGFGLDDIDPVQAYIAILTAIGGVVIEVKGLEDISAFILQLPGVGMRKVTTLPVLSHTAELLNPDANPHTLSDIDYAITEARLAVAENGVVWITEQQAGHRVLPFICQHLIVLLHVADIVSTMHNAYDKIGGSIYGYGAFIAGPSKTADIEQSLVLGAHGPRSMTILLIK